jgi:hypothetical protein
MLWGDCSNVRSANYCCKFINRRAQAPFPLLKIPKMIKKPEAFFSIFFVQASVKEVQSSIKRMPFLLPGYASHCL